MKTKNILVSGLCCLLLLATACQEDDYPKAIAAKVQTGEVSDITGSSAISNGSMIIDEGSPVSTRGIVWDTLPGPVIGDNVAFDETGNESFTLEMSGLKGGMKYYIRAFATNIAGISFGNERTFNTKEVPILETMEADDSEFIGGRSAEFGGEIINDFGMNIIEVGLCWGEDKDPTIEDDYKVASDAVSNPFTALMEGLKPSTVYHVRAYAIADNGEVGYGQDELFETLIMDYDDNIYTSVKIAGLTWMVENFESTHYNDGTEIEYAFHPNDPEGEYGASYAWTDIVKENFAPEGWHVATFAEWRTLYDHVEGDGTKLKEAGTDHWNTDNGTNETGFTAFGSAHIYGAALKAEGTWWTSNELDGDPSQGLRWSIFDSGDLGNNPNTKNFKFPVRLVKDY